MIASPHVAVRVFSPTHCPSCGESAERAFRDRLRHGEDFLVRGCRICGHQVLQRCPALPFDGDDEFEPVILDRYIRAMKESRQAAARTILKAVAREKPAQGKLLDVGASFGWLVEEALRAGWEAEGIEPSSIACDAARRQGLPVSRGFFPDDLREVGRRWEAITLMDVLEHLEQPIEILAAIRSRLSPDGVLALQVPNSRGLFLRVSKGLVRATSGRLAGPLLRMYQTQFSYPHLHYFHPDNMHRLLSRAGFQVLNICPTPTIAGATADRVGYLKPEYAGVPSSGLISQAMIWGSSVINVAAQITGLHDTFYCIARPDRRPSACQAA